MNKGQLSLEDLNRVNGGGLLDSMPFMTKRTKIVFKLTYKNLITGTNGSIMITVIVAPLKNILDAIKEEAERICQENGWLAEDVEPESVTLAPME